MNYYFNKQLTQSATYDPESLSDTDLLKRCQQLGSISVKSRRMFVGLLPLIARRNIYNMKKFSSIFHFALIVGGVNYEVASEVLRLDAQLIDLPHLRRALYRGEIGWSKIRAVLSLVTSGNEETWLEMLRNLSKPALEVYVRDYQQQQKDEQHTLFSNSTNPSTCLPINNILLSPSFQENVANKAKKFPGEITRIENKNEMSQIDNSGSHQPISQKFNKLSTSREIMSFHVNSLLAARLRLFRQKLEKRLKKLTTWENVLNELLRKSE
ncbi:MAG: hypothetical protein NTX63_05465 [Candidatus Peregrinibacteria bacterium]|nr:hypothetical protein [Candidatus Peregrinibacteria bacterium]